MLTLSSQSLMSTVSGRLYEVGSEVIVLMTFRGSPEAGGKQSDLVGKVIRCAELAGEADCETFVVVLSLIVLQIQNVMCWHVPPEILWILNNIGTHGLRSPLFLRPSRRPAWFGQICRAVQLMFRPVLNLTTTAAVLKRNRALSGEDGKCVDAYSSTVTYANQSTPATDLAGYTLTVGAISFSMRLLDVGAR